jgi:hypothetical protein
VQKAKVEGLDPVQDTRVTARRRKNDRECRMWCIECGWVHQRENTQVEQLMAEEAKSSGVMKRAMK